MAGKPIVVAIAADTKEFGTGIDKAKGDLGGLADAAQTEGRKAGVALDQVGEAADGVASTSSQVAGGLGDLGGALSMLPGPLGAAGTGMEALAPAIMGVTGASDLLNAATTKFPGVAKVASASARGLGVAVRFATGPVGLLITAAALLATGLVIAYKRSETFRNIVNGAFRAVKAVAATVGGAFKSVWDGATKWLGKVWDYVSGLPGKIRSKFSGMWTGLAGGLKSALNAVLHLPLKIPRINTHIPGVGTVGGQTLIPALAKGGLVDRPTLALVGEAGPEVVIPLDRLGQFGGGMTFIYRIDLSGTFIGGTKAEVGRWLQSALDAARRGGNRRRAA